MLAVRVESSLQDELTELLSKAVSEDKFEAPKLPHIALEVLKIAQDAQASMPKIGSFVAKDATLAARVMRVASSSAYAGPPVPHLAAAMVRIGLDALKNILYVYSFNGAIARRIEFQSVFQRYWIESVTGAVAADAIARHRKQDIHLPFLAGLLHDLGRSVALNMCVEMRRTNERMKKADEPTILKLVETVHARLGGLIAARWNLPLPLRDTIGFHHDALNFRGTSKELVLTIAAADIIVERVVGTNTAPVLTAEQIRVIRELGFDRQTLESVGVTIKDRAEKLAASMTAG
jgi:HD-like signal output (HDOD) protein